MEPCLPSQAPHWCSLVQVLMGDSKRYTCPEPHPFLEEADARNQASVAYKCVLPAADARSSHHCARVMQCWGSQRDRLAIAGCDC